MGGGIFSPSIFYVHKGVFMAQDPIAAEPEVQPFAGPEIAEPTFLDDLPPLTRQKPLDPEMDPGDRRWNPKKYFGAQPKEIVVVKRTNSDVLTDPTDEHPIDIPVSINGYQIIIRKGVPTRVPRDFATHLVDIGAAYRYSSLPEVE